MPADRFDVGVIGGGPAGSLTALKLARAGHRVVQLVCAVQHIDSVETLTPNAAQMLKALGLGHIVAAAVRGRVQRTLLRWRTTVPERLSATDKPVVFIDRHRFDAALLAASRLAGVTVFESSMRCRFARHEFGWQARSESAGHAKLFLCTHIVDGRGRASANKVHPVTALPHNVALSQSFRTPPSGENEMRIEAIEDGWIWGARLADGLNKLEVFLDHSLCAGLDARARADAVAVRLHKSELFADRLPPENHSVVTVRDTASRFADDSSAWQLFKTGDASFTIDPVSGQGLGIAMRGAMHTAAAVASVLGGGSRTEIRRFYQSARQQTFEQAVKDCAALYGSQNIYHTPYWQAVEPGPSQPAAKRCSGDLDTPFRLATNARIHYELCPGTDHLTKEAVISHPQLSRPVASVGHLPAARFARCFSRPNTARRATITLEPELDFDGGQYLLDWCLSRGLLVAV